MVFNALDFCNYKCIVYEEMATEEHLALAQFLKDVHLSLRQATHQFGAQQAWEDHCSKQNTLKTYAVCMEKLATKYWAENCENETSGATSRIHWAAKLINDYFINESYLKYRVKEVNIGKQQNFAITVNESFSNPIKLIDVGSCYNPFKVFDFLDVLAIDLWPANDSVLQCDFLSVPLGVSTIVSKDNKLKQLQMSFFDVVTFCFLLEYIPSSELRIKACEKAYDILRPGGLLIINTPDSKHVGANSKIMKCWRYTLAIMGFMRIKYEKLKHMHCMAFRKTVHRESATLWSVTHKEPYMDYSIHIPQDYQDNEQPKAIKVDVSLEDFQELPFNLNYSDL